MRKRKLLTLFLFVCLYLFLFILLSKYDVKENTSDNVNSQNKNAIWLRHQWVGESHTEAEYRELANLLKNMNISDAYFHVGPLNSEGNIEKEKYQFANTLVDALNSHYRELNVQAWIGQVEKKGGGPLDISDASTRDNVVNTAKTFTDIGFEGIHYNIEPIYSGDENIIDLLKRTKTATDGKLVSIASDELEMFPGAERLVRLFSKQVGFWNRDYYVQVSQEADQIAVMMYDTAIPFPSIYAEMVEWQTKNLLREVGKETTLFMGVPTYEDRRITFNPRAENMSSALTGIKKGLANYSENQLENFGVAIYAEWTTDETEWKTYQSLWLGL